MLIAHGPVEAALCHFIARCLEMDAAELLIDIALRDGRLSKRPRQECEAACQHAECAPHWWAPFLPCFLRLLEILHPKEHDCKQSAVQFKGSQGPMCALRLA